jgi:hypothetical protein
MRIEAPVLVKSDHGAFELIRSCCCLRHEVGRGTHGEPCVFNRITWWVDSHHAARDYFFVGFIHLYL